jgi:hypothetical protein
VLTRCANRRFAAFAHCAQAADRASACVQRPEAASCRGRREPVPEVGNSRGVITMLWMDRVRSRTYHTPNTATRTTPKTADSGKWHSEAVGEDIGVQRARHTEDNDGHQ